MRAYLLCAAYVLAMVGLGLTPLWGSWLEYQALAFLNWALKPLYPEGVLVEVCKDGEVTEYSPYRVHPVDSYRPNFGTVNRQCVHVVSEVDGHHEWWHPLWMRRRCRRYAPGEQAVWEVHRP